MLKNLFLIANLFLWTPAVQGQSAVEKFVQDHTTKINSIDLNNKDDADLVAIGKAIGNAQVVMLGEQDHGDAPAFEAKARIIRYLHEEKGFNVIAFESDFYALNQGFNQVLRNKLSSDSLLQQNVFGVWTNCKECETVFSYINSTQTTRNRINITGFDLQLHGLYSRKNFKHDLHQYLTAQKIPFRQTLAYQNQFLPALDSLVFFSNKSPVLVRDETFAQTIKYLDLIITQLKVRDKADEFWRQILESVRAQAVNMQLVKHKNTKAFTLRDEQMAKNLDWLINNPYKNEKVIVWAANAHINKFNFNGESEKITGINRIPMGYFFTETFGNSDKTYVLGFTSYQGQAGRINNPKKFKVAVAAEDGFEQWVNKLKHNYAFTDMKPLKKFSALYQEPFYAKFNNHTNIKTEWAKGFDGIFFIHTMFPCQEK